MTKPITIPIPSPGKLCPYTGLKRGMINNLVLPNNRNNYDPPVQSLSFRTPGQKRGKRLVIYESLMQHLAKLARLTCPKKEMITPPIPLAEIEQRHIEQTVARCKGNKTAAAKILGISDRTVRFKMAQYDRNPPLEPLHACPFCTEKAQAA